MTGGSVFRTVIGHNIEFWEVIWVGGRVSASLNIVECKPPRRQARGTMQPIPAWTGYNALSFISFLTNINRNLCILDFSGVINSSNCQVWVLERKSKSMVWTSLECVKHIFPLIVHLLRNLDTQIFPSFWDKQLLCFILIM